ncbi:LamG-like jellyroll fold domain-containing protein [Gramella sp. MAR_2010_147]|uniref:LamG-like jellyroll fold domain-containing protein n=1 Tax=Gramella sp. MAR_2010_147 TaxID=1250205 RepID=UPI00087CDFF3|nr:LamG-like jellyroll fold domain-containing protein [Gramella sp. MAR_2010_147]SDS08020.1 Por secretion system C-terminal sorting domain-containing protein [Gramella sp. MAR_2010_147]
MYKTTFGPRIHHVLLIILLFFTISSLKGSEAYGFIITGTEVDNRDYFDKIKISNSTFEVAFSHYPKLNSIRNEKRSLSELIDFNSNIEIKHAYSSNLDLELNDNGEITLNKSDLDLSIFDGLGLNIISEIIFSQETFDCSNVGNNTVTITASDIFGRSVSLDLDIRINDSMAPVARAKDITVFLDSAGQIVISPEEIDNGSWDNCSIDLLSIDRSAFNFTNLGSNNITLTVTDIYSNWSTANATVTVQDNEPPTVRTKDISIELDSNGQASIQPLDVDDGSTDNSEIDSYSLDISNFDCSDIGQNTVVLTVTDIESNSASAEALVTVIDNSDPTITAPSDIQADTDSSDCNASSLNLGTATTSDNCNVASVVSDAPTDFPLGQTTVTWTVTDDAGNTATDTQIVNVTDNTNPTITAPADIQTDTDSVDCNASGVTLGTATTADNCNVASVVNDAPTDFPLGQTTVTWTITDDAGNTATDTQIVNVTDNTNPTITAPANIQTDTDSVDCNASGVTLGTAATADNCNVASVVNDAPTDFPLGQTTVTWTVTDDAGNTATDTQIITVTDNTNPTITAPVDVEANTDAADCNAYGVTLGTATTADNCNVALVENDAPTDFPLGQTTVTWTVTDDAGNTATDTQIVNVTDNVKPLITASADIDTTNDTGSCEASLNITPATATDNCSTPAPVGTRSDGLSLNDPYPTGSTVITWNVEDDNGNIAESVDQIVIVEDTEAPVQPEVEDILWGCEYTVEAPIAIDNCSGEVTGTTTNPTTYSTTGVYEITWIFQDEYGNTSQLIQTVEIDELTVGLSKTDVLCNGFETGEVVANVTGGVQPYYYSWKDANNAEISTESSISNLPAGNYSVTVKDLNNCEITTQVEIEQPETLSMTAPTSTATTCFDGSDGSITVGTMTGGTAPYLYSIDNTNFQSETTFNNLPAGDYTIFVKDANNCSLQIETTITEPEVLSGTLSKTDVKCFEGSDGTISISNASGGTAGFEYSIDNGTTWQLDPNFTNLAADTYDILIRDNSQTACEVNLGNITVNQPATKISATITTTRTSGAGTATGSATANPTGGTPGYTYSWVVSGSTTVIQTTKTANNLEAGEYTVTVTDINGCSISKDITIIDTIEATISARSICEGGAGDIRKSYYKVLDDTATGGIGPYTYSWDFGSGASPASANTSNGSTEHRISYSTGGLKEVNLTVTDSQGESKLIIIEQFIGTCFANDCGSNDLRVNDFYVGDANGNQIGSADCLNVGPKYLYLSLDEGPDRYSLYIELAFVKENRFLNSSPQGITEVGTFYCNETIPDQARLFELENWVCGDEITIDSVYLTFQNNKNKKCGTSNKPKCFGSDDSNEVTTPLFAVATPNEILCNGTNTGVIEIEVSGGAFPYDYSITSSTAGFQSERRFQDLPAGDYIAWVRDSQGEVFQTDQVTIVAPTNPIEVTPSISEEIECFGDTGEATVSATGGTPFESGPAYQYLWNDPNEQTTSTAVDLAPGEYTVTVIDANGCQEIESITLVDAPELSVPIAGEPQELGCGILSTTLNANTPESGIGKWTIDTSVSPTGGQFTDDTNPKTTFTGNQGIYTLIWTIANEDGSCARFDTVEISIVGECSKLDFDGVDDHITFNDSYGLTSGSFSLEIWIKPESTSGVQTVISKKDKTSSSAGYELIINNGSPSFKWNGKTLSTGNKIGTDRWYHIAVIYNGTARLYVDGIDVGNASGSNPTTTTAPFLLGALYDSTSPNSPKNFYSGWMEEFRVWNVALTKEQLQFMMNQKLTQNGTLTKGQVLPMNVPGNLPWANLKGYYRLDPLETLNGLTLDISSSPVNGEMRNIITDQKLSAPLPYISEATGSWRERSTWDTNIGNEQEKWWDVPNGIGVNGDRINWNIVETSHNINSSAQDIYVLGLLSKTQELKIDGNVDNQTGQGLTVTKYLKLDGTINLEGNSQLVQTTGSILDEASTGYIDIDQQGTANSFNYNYWTSPVSLISSANNSGYTIDSVLMDGTNPDEPQSLSFSYQFHWADGNYSGNKRISSYWLYTFKGTANDYSEWHQFGESEALEAGIGFSMKGTTGYVPVSNRQNYTFRGKPNNGDIKVSIGASDQNLLTGNPYPSAIDALEFIGDNLGGFNGSLYFWDHFGAVNSHYLEEYVGGYAVYNLSGGIASASSVDSRINPTGEKSAKAPPGRYIPVGQAFFISSTGVSSPKEITYKNKYRAFVPESTDDSQFHSQEKVNPKKEQEQYKKDSRYKIRLKFESPKGYHRQILVTADVNSSSGFDLGYDAPLFENNVEDMYWMIEETEFVIQAVPDFNLNQVLPIGLKISEAGEYTIKLDSLENIKSEFNIYLKDKLNDAYFDLVKDNYTTTAEEVGSFNERFEIVFQKPVTEEPIKENPDLIDSPILDLSYLRDTDEIAVLNPDLMNVDFVELYSISGQLIKTFKEVPTERAILLSINQKLSSAVYIVRIYSGENTYSRKVIITK